MRLESFRIHGFRSIEDSGEIHVASDITVFAGKNESGKSAVLEALSRFLGPKSVPLTSRDTTFDYEGEPSLEATFVLTDEELSRISENTSLPLTERRVVIKSYVDRYETVGPAKEELSSRLLRESEAIQKGVAATVSSSLLDQEPEISYMSQEDLVKLARERSREAKEDSPLYALVEELDRLSGLEGSLINIDEVFTALIPKAVIFRSFQDELPDTVALNDASQTSRAIVGSFCKLANLDIEALKRADDPHDRSHLTEKATGVYSAKFGQFWNQEPLRVGVAYDTGTLVFKVWDEDKYSYKPSERSQGLKWYTSFFITLAAEKAESNPAIVLIDEPGLYLHAKAQKDLLALLKDMASAGYQIIVASHSPFVMDPDRLDRIRLVEKDPKTKRTSVKNSWYCGVDKETITPLLTAIGVELTSVTPFLANQNVIVEGPTDYYYLMAVRTVLRRHGRDPLPLDTRVIPCMGHANVGFILSLILGANLDYAILLDRKGTKRTVEMLEEQGVPHGKIICAGGDEKSSLADLFTEDDLSKHIMGDIHGKSDEPLSKLVKREKVSETILARRLMDMVVKGEVKEFSTTTLDAFESLLKKVANALKALSGDEVPQMEAE